LNSLGLTQLVTHHNIVEQLLKYFICVIKFQPNLGVIIQNHHFTLLKLNTNILLLRQKKPDSNQ